MNRSISDFRMEEAETSRDADKYFRGVVAGLARAAGVDHVVGGEVILSYDFSMACTVATAAFNSSTWTGR